VAAPLAKVGVEDTMVAMLMECFFSRLVSGQRGSTSVVVVVDETNHAHQGDKSHFLYLHQPPSIFTHLTTVTPHVGGSSGSPQAVAAILAASKNHEVADLRRSVLHAIDLSYQE
jgi:hypothetical protein